MAKDNKDASLEALRGIAAIIVVFGHSMMGFFPASSGFFTYFPLEQSLVGQPWFGLLNGSAAVGFFFVLSGFVLTRQYFKKRNDLSIVRGVVKRWPRLVVPVITTVLMSWALFALDLYRFTNVAPITNSAWLYYFAFAYQTPFVPDFWGAIMQGGFLTFFRGDSYYDSSLWTMRIELIGSYIAFALALVLVRLSAASVWVAIILVTFVVLLCHYVSPYFVAFPAGVALAFFLVRWPFVMPFWLPAILLLFSGYLAGYSGHPIGAYQPFASLSLETVPSMYVYIFASVVAITAVEAWVGGRQVLQNFFFLFIGEISFPLYLVHVPVLCSAGCWAFLVAQSYNAQWASWIGAAVTFVGSFIAAVPLMLLNRVWLAALNRFMSRAIPANPALDLGADPLVGRSAASAGT
jgi:peptidoglycan/LPS O-acetylase OafA/YrhL